MQCFASKNCWSDYLKDDQKYNITTSIQTIIYNYPVKNIIKTNNSESRGQEEAWILCKTKNTRPLSKLFTRNNAQNLTNTLANLP